MEFRALRPDELDQWIEHCTTVFTDETDTDAYFRNHILLDPGHDFGGMFIAKDNGKIVASAQVFLREMHIQGQAVKMGGIAEAATNSAYRKQGLSGKILEMCIDYMEKMGCDISLLFTGLYAHYARYGWFVVYCRYVPADGITLQALPDNYALSPLCAADIPEIMPIYQRFAQNIDGTLQRDNAEYWQKWLMHNWHSPFVLRREEKIIAYMDMWTQNNTATLMDYACIPEEESLMPMLSKYAGDNPEIRQILLPSPLLPAQNGPFSKQEGMMFRLNKPFTLHGNTIDTAGKLAKVLGDLVFWGPDFF